MLFDWGQNSKGVFTSLPPPGQAERRRSLVVQVLQESGLTPGSEVRVASEYRASNNPTQVTPRSETHRGLKFMYSWVHNAYH